MFSVEDRERVTDRLVEEAHADPRVIATAAIGSSANGGDRWSDIDLTFSVAGEVPIEEVLTDWTRWLESEFDAEVLFDLPSLSTIYRVFLLPGALQVDLSFTPAAEFGARGPRFRLLFGEAAERPWMTPASPRHMFGLGIHHVVRAHICIERGRLWQAEYWIHEARDEALSLACHRLGLQASEGRGFDYLPSEVRDRWAGTLVANLNANELRRALTDVTTGLLLEGDDGDRVTRLRVKLRELMHPASM